MIGVCDDSLGALGFGWRLCCRSMLVSPRRVTYATNVLCFLRLASHVRTFANSARYASICGGDPNLINVRGSEYGILLSFESQERI